jgi:hypothetical protein
MTSQNNNFWDSYIKLIGTENFFRNGMFIQSKHYCGMDISLAQGAEEFSKPQLESIIKKHNAYKVIQKQEVITNEDLEEIFSYIIEKPFFDNEYIHLFDNFKIEQTIEEHWELIKNIWQRQELNTNGTRKDNWKKIFGYRETIASLTVELPDTFKAYRAGNADGFSWTLDKEVAEWFHKRFMQQFGKIPFLEKEFNKKDVIFYTNARNEKEVVIVPK